MIINNLEFTASLEDILEELRSQLSMNGIKYLQKQPKVSGNNIQVQCVYHGNGNEHKPSAGIHRQTGVYHCFSCGETHDLPEVISYCFGKNDMGAFGWQWLLKNFLTIAKEERNVNLDFSRDVDRNNRSNDNNNNTYVSEEELDSYRWTHPYWKERGITDENIIELFDLGVDLDNRMITFPVRDVDGNCLFVAKRSVKTKFFHYPEGVKKPLYGLYEIHQQFDSYSKDHSKAEVLNFDFDIDSTRPIGVNFPSEIMVCESMIDCILLWQAGYYAVALNGLGNNLQMKQLQDLPCRKLILATDNDEAGLRARDRIKKNVKGKLFTEIYYPDGVKDPGDLTEDERLHILEYEDF